MRFCVTAADGPDQSFCTTIARARKKPADTDNIKTLGRSEHHRLNNSAGPHVSPGRVASRREGLWVRAVRPRPAVATLDGSLSRPTAHGEADARHYGDAAETR
jgi:hypothetical protein